MTQQQEKNPSEFLVLSDRPITIPSSLNASLVVVDDIGGAARAYLNLPSESQATTRKFLVVTDAEVARDLKLQLFEDGKISSCDSISLPSSPGDSVAIQAFREKLEKRAVESVTVTKFDGYKTVKFVHLGAKESFEDCKDQIEADPAGVKVLCGETGSGKTTFSDARCTEIVENGGRITHLSPSKMIAACQTEKFKKAGLSVAHYEEMTAEHLLNREKYSLVSTMHSAYTDRVKHSSKGADLLVIDEAFSGIRQMATFEDLRYRLKALTHISSLFSASTNLLALDADLNDRDLKFLDAAKNPNGVTVYYKGRDCSGISATFHDHYACIVERFLETLSAGKTAMLASDSKLVCETFHKLAEESGHKGLLITQDTASGEAVRRFESDPNGELEREQYDYVIYSPRYFRFGSVETSHFSACFAICCGIVTPADFIQGLRRNRVATHFDIAFKMRSKRGYWDEVFKCGDADELISSHCAESRLLAEESMITLPAAMKAVGFTVKHEHLPAVKRRENYEHKTPPAPFSISKSLKMATKLYNEAEKEVKNGKVSLIATANLISVDLAKEKFSDRESLSDAERAEVDKTMCNHLLGSHSNDDISWYAEGAAVGKLKMLSIFEMSEESRKHRDRFEMNNKCSMDKTYYQAKHRDLSRFVAIIRAPGGFSYKDLSAEIDKMERSDEWKNYNLPRPPKNCGQGKRMQFALKLVNLLGYNHMRTSSGSKYVLTNQKQVSQYLAHQQIIESEEIMEISQAELLLMSAA